MEFLFDICIQIASTPLRRIRVRGAFQGGLTSAVLYALPFTLLAIVMAATTLLKHTKFRLGGLLFKTADYPSMVCVVAFLLRRGHMSEDSSAIVPYSGGYGVLQELFHVEELIGSAVLHLKTAVSLPILCSIVFPEYFTIK